MAGDLQTCSTKEKLKGGTVTLPSILLWDVTIVTCCKRTSANDSLVNSVCKHYQDAVKQTVPTDAHCSRQCCSTQQKTEAKKTQPPLQVFWLNIKHAAFFLYVGLSSEKGVSVWNPAVKHTKRFCFIWAACRETLGCLLVSSWEQDCAHWHTHSKH